MKYLAHKKEEKEQTIKEHLFHTAELAGQFASRFGNADWGYCAGMLHDIGKYSSAFQEKIRADSNRKVDHSTAGAKVCLEKDGVYHFLSYCIAGHHSGLPDSGSSSDTGNMPTLRGRERKRIEDFSAYKEEIQVPELKTLPFDPKTVPDVDFSLSVFIRILYSCLVDADFLDTEAAMAEGLTMRDPGEEMAVLFRRLKKFITGWLQNEETNTVNGRRTEILKCCLESGRKGKGLFQLTVPTGGGKTIASLAFALQHAVEHQMDRIIYVIPYTSIIEQNAEIFRRILGEQNVLENHYNVDYGNSEELKPMQLAAENWDKPVVVTTNVQFFESLFANRSSKCRKLHNIANSVIIFDEAQMLPTDYLKPCIAMMEELVGNYGASIVLCTATQPVLGPFFRRDLQVTELCPRIEEQFRFFRRTRFQNEGTLSEETLLDKLKEETEALCIVNTKKRAQNLYRKLKGPGVFHLSTAMYPKHRKRILAQIRAVLERGERCILIATSLVEAGVDLDFHTVYRQLAGVDSMVQAAGRCNREGKRNADESITHLFSLDGKERVPGQQLPIDVSKILLAEGKEITTLQGVASYFEALYHFRGESLDKKNILGAFKGGKCPFARIARDFKLIEEQTKTVFIAKEEESKQLLMLLKHGGCTKTRMRQAGQYCIQLYENELEKLQGAGMLRPISDEIEDFFELRDENQYMEDMGLDLSLETGMAVIL